MSVANKILQAAAGNAGGDAVYVEDVFSTYVYKGTGFNHTIDNGINLGSLNVNTVGYRDDNTARTVVLDHLAEGDVVVVFNTGAATGATVTVGGSSATVLEQDFNWPTHNYYQSTFRYTVASGDPALMEVVITNNTYGGLILVIKGGVTVTLQAGASENSANTITEPNFSTTGYGLILTSDRDGSATSLTSTDPDLTNLCIDDESSFFVNSCWEMDSGNGGTISGFNSGSNFAQVHVVLKVEGAGTTAFGNTEADGGLVWLKNRDQSDDHLLFDTQRNDSKLLSTHSTNAANLLTTGVTTFNASGFNVGSNQSANTNNEEFVSWTFRKKEKFFDIVTWSGNSTSGRTVSHNLGSVPGMIIVKRTDTTGAWQVYHRSNTANPEQNYLVLNTTATTNASTSRWNDTAPTSTEFTLGNSSTVNATGGTYVAYLFAHDEQNFGENSDESIVYCGTYEGDGGTQEITLGWEPQWIISKNIDDGSNNWMIMDVMRGAPFEGDTAVLTANQNAAESVGSNPTKWYPTATGFKVKQGGNGASDPNENGETYVYAAIRRPHKPASEFVARALFETVAGRGNPAPNYLSGFPVDMYFQRYISTTDNLDWSSRSTQGKTLTSVSSSAQSTNADFSFDYQDGVMSGGYGNTTQAWMFRRAPKFFDVVAYNATGSIQTITHNLGVTPELMIVKDRDSSVNWGVWHKDLPDPDDEALLLNSTNAKFSSTIFNKALPTSTTFQVNYTGGLYIAYLFASVDGISKVGSFSRTSGDTTNVDCGFSNGARFVFLKRINNTGQWVFWDDVRGIVAGNEPYLALQSTAAQITNQDYIDPLSSGFTVNGGIATGDWIFYAIA